MKNFLSISLILMLLSVSTASYSAQPLWTFTPLTATTISITDDHTATIQYLVTNQSRQNHTLMMIPIAGIAQSTSGPGICPSPFTLSYQQSCALSLSVDGSILPGDIAGGPVACQQGSQSLCYQPSVPNQLNITKTEGATISVSGSPLTLDTDGSDGVMTITNISSSVAALDITADFLGTALDGDVSISLNTCGSTLAPSSSCTLAFTPGSLPVTQTSFPIAGSNTNTIMGAITINSAPHIIFVTSASYNGNLGGVTGANTKCNSDSAKPNSGFAAGYTYKALLNNNNATRNGVTYYRPDGNTIIAIATGGNLVDANTLTNAIAPIAANAWTGNNSNNCLAWTNNSVSNAGHDGRINFSTSQYWDFSNIACNANLQLYCVSQ